MTKTTEDTEYLTYVFASVRGPDLMIDVPLGTSVEDAYKLLCKREIDNGSLWKLVNNCRNKIAIEDFGFHPYSSMAYKVIHVGK